MSEHKKNMQKQHYVPKCLLKNFSIGKELFVFDKHTGRIEIKNIKSVCSSFDFYEIQLNEIMTLSPEIKQKIMEVTSLNGDDIEKIINKGALSLEGTLAQIETVAGEIIKKVKERKSIKLLSPEERFTLCLFVATQYLRTGHQRKSLQSFIECVKERTKHFYNPDSGISIDDFIDKQIGKSPELEAKLITMQTFKDLAIKYALILFSKNIILFKTSIYTPFYISDCPVTLRNDRMFGPYGNLGLLCPGVEIYMPISSIYALGFLCPTITPPYNVLIDPSIMDAWKYEISGAPIPCLGHFLKCMNFSQIQFAERYICCEKNDFSLVMEVLERQPELKHSGFKLVVD